MHTMIEQTNIARIRQIRARTLFSTVLSEYGINNLDLAHALQDRLEQEFSLHKKNCEDFCVKKREFDAECAL